MHDQVRANERANERKTRAHTSAMPSSIEWRWILVGQASNNYWQTRTSNEEEQEEEEGEEKEKTRRKIRLIWGAGKMPCACIQQCATTISSTVVSLPPSLSLSISIFLYDRNNNDVTSYLPKRQHRFTCLDICTLINRHRQWTISVRKENWLSRKDEETILYWSFA